MLPFTLAYSIPALSDNCNDISPSYSRIIAKNINDSKLCIVYIADVHKPAIMDRDRLKEIMEMNPKIKEKDALVKDIQKEVYLTLEDLILNHDLQALGLEGSDSSHDIKKEDISDKSAYFKDNRIDRAVLDRLIQGMLETDDVSSAGQFAELFYHDRITTFGVEDMVLFQKQLEKFNDFMKIYDRIIKDSSYPIKDAESDIDKAEKDSESINAERSFAAINKLVAKMEADKLSNGALLMGGMHKDSVIDAFDRAISKGKRLSYIVLEPNTAKRFDEIKIEQAF